MGGSKEENVEGLEESKVDVSFSYLYKAGALVLLARLLSGSLLNTGQE